MDHDIEEAADKAAAGQVPATMKQPATFDVEPYDRLEPAALQPIPGDTVPAEAVEAAVNAAYDYDEARYFNAFKSSIGGMTAALAAAAPLIVADRDATIRRLRAAMKALDDGLAQHGEHIERLAAERDAAEAKIDAAKKLIDPVLIGHLEIRRALTGDIPGGSR